MVKKFREDWFHLARRLLIREGIAAVSVQHLARKLGVTRGSFYGYFGSREALLAGLLADWRESNTRSLRRISASNASGRDQFAALVSMWIRARDYSPQYDSAVRDWARSAPHVARSVRRIDEERIRLITRIFMKLGFPRGEARIRARITYYHQVGYYTLAIHETARTRERLSPMYSLVLTGAPVALPGCNA